MQPEYICDYLPVVLVFTKLYKFPRPIHNYIIDFISEGEMWNQRHLFKAFSCCLPCSQPPKTSSINEMKKKKKRSSKIQNLNCQCSFLAGRNAQIFGQAKSVSNLEILPPQHFAAGNAACFLLFALAKYLTFEFQSNERRMFGETPQRFPLSTFSASFSAHFSNHRWRPNSLAYRVTYVLI